jgi:glycosyltransferase involved in cell wall biosynthesis
MKEIKISVIIPVYNAEKFIERAVQSVLIQPEVDEIILIDDGSKDASYEIIQDLASKNDFIRILTHPGRMNKGPAATRNLGILNTKNEWIAFLDADDYYLDNRFKKDVEIINKNSNVDGVYGNVDYNNNYEDTNPYNISQLDNVLQKDLFFEMSPIGKRGRFHINALLIKKAKLIEIKNFDETLRFGEDILLFLKLSIVANLVNNMLQNSFSVKESHDDNMTKNLTVFEANKYLTRVFENLLLWEHEKKTKEHKNEMINKYLYYKTESNKKKLMVELLKIIVRFPQFVFSAFFFYNLKHILKPKANDL